MRLRVALFLLLPAIVLIAQSDRGTITGTVVDATGSVVANAAVEAKNTETGAAYPVAASGTGNYTIPQLPAGTYELDITVPGFKKFMRPGLIIQAAKPSASMPRSKWAMPPRRLRCRARRPNCKPKAAS